MRPLTVTFSTRISDDHRELSVARSQIGEWLAGHPIAAVRTGTVPGDVEMVVSELGANVIDHTDSPWMQLDVDVRDDRAVITVSNPAPADRVPPVPVWGTLEGGDRGRGLRIVRALCHSIVVTGDAGLTDIRCEIAFD